MKILFLFQGEDGRDGYGGLGPNGRKAIKMKLKYFFYENSI